MDKLSGVFGMRIGYIFLITLMVFWGGSISAGSQSASSRPLDSPDKYSMMVLDDDDEEITWPFEPDEWAEEDENIKEEEPAEDEQAVEESEEGGEETGDEESPGKETNVSRETTEEESQGPESAVDDPEWDAIQGVKVPYFFLVDIDGLDEDEDDISIVDLKALKYGGQILNGIPFVYNIGSGDVYITDNAGSIPEHIRYIDEIAYAGVIRYDYEVAQPQADYDKGRTSRRAVVAAEKSGSSIASAFESSRSDAFIKAVKSAAQHLSAKFKKDQNQVTGVINAWEILNEGYIQETESFYIEMRAWITFDGYE